jgi:hypothetical protein
MNPPPSPLSGQLRIRPMRRKADVARLPVSMKRRTPLQGKLNLSRKPLSSFLDFKKMAGNRSSGNALLAMRPMHGHNHLWVV